MLCLCLLVYVVSLLSLSTLVVKVYLSLYTLLRSHFVRELLYQEMFSLQEMGLLPVLTAVIELIFMPLISKTNCCISSVFLSLSVTRGQPLHDSGHTLWHVFAFTGALTDNSFTLQKLCARNTFCCGRSSSIWAGWQWHHFKLVGRLAWFKMQLLSANRLLFPQCFHSL